MPDGGAHRCRRGRQSSPRRLAPTEAARRWAALLQQRFTGPIARTVTNAAIALAVMAGKDSLDPPTMHASVTLRTPTDALDNASLKGKRFGVPAFMMVGSGIPFHGIPAGVLVPAADFLRTAANMALHDDTRALFMAAITSLRAAAAEVALSDQILSKDFAKMASRVSTYAYMRDGTDRFLAAFGPAALHSASTCRRVRRRVANCSASRRQVEVHLAPSLSPACAAPGDQ